MTTFVKCDGCGRYMQPNSMEHAIHGERANDLRGGFIPHDDFDLCFDCGSVAFAAARDWAAKKQAQKRADPG